MEQAAAAEPFLQPYWVSTLRNASVAGLRRALTVSPTAFAVAAALARAEQDAGAPAAAEAVFRSHLLVCPFADLYVAYTEVVAATKLAPAQAALAAALARGAGATDSTVVAALAAVGAGQRSLLEAFEFAVDKVGSSFDAGPLWASYALFLASLPADNAYAAGQARELRRKLYGRAVRHAHAAVVELWEQYCAFERDAAAGAGSSVKLAESLIAGRAADEATASAVYKERVSLWASIDLKSLPLPPPRPEHASFSGASAALSSQVAAWLRLLTYELGNPLQLPADGHKALMRLVFTQALSTSLRYCPDIWHDFAAFVGAPGAREVYAQARAALPTSIALAAAAAEWHEAAGAGEEADKVFASLLATLHAVASGAHGAWRKGPEAGQAAAVAPAAVDDDDEEAAPGVVATRARAAVPPVRARGGAVDVVAAATDAAAPFAPFSPFLILCRPGDEADATVAIPSVFILHQRSARRVEGVEGARRVFKAARKSPHVTPAVYLASAQLEYASNRALPVARNIIEAARKAWPADVELACGAIDFLAPLDEATNVRALLEACLASVKPADSRPVWDRFIAYELAWAPGGGSLPAVAAIERRRAGVHPHLASTHARLLSRTVHRTALFLPAGVAPSALSGVDAELYSRCPHAPFSSLPSVAGMVAREGTSDEPPSVETPLSLLAGERSVFAAARDGLALQAPPLFSGTLAHIGAREALHAGRAGAGAGHAAEGEGGHAPRGWLAEDGAGPAARSFHPPPPALLALLACLPAFDAAAGPPPVEAAMAVLLAGAAGQGRSGGSTAGRLPKRARPA